MIKNIFSVFISFFFFVVANVSLAQKTESEKWNLDKGNSKLTFSVEHMEISEVEGRFSDFEVVLNMNELELEKATATISIFSNSFNTGNAERDSHIKSYDFLYVEKFPKIAFVSKQFIKIDSINYKLKGNLTIRAITKEVELDVKMSKRIKDLWDRDRFGLKITGTIQREQFGLTLNRILETGLLAIGKNIEIKSTLQFFK